MKRFHLIPIVLLILSAVMAPAQDQPAATSSSVQQQSQTFSPPAATAATQPSTEKKVTAYTLPPDLYKKAHDLSRIHFRLALIGFVYGLVVLWVVLRSKLAACYRDWTEAFSAKRFRQSAFCKARCFHLCCCSPRLFSLCRWMFMGSGSRKNTEFPCRDGVRGAGIG